MAGDRKSKRGRSAAGPGRSARRASGAAKPGPDAAANDAAKSARAPAGEGTAAKASTGPVEPPAPPEGAPGGVPGALSTGELRLGPNIITEIAVREVSEVEGVAEISGGWRTKGVQVAEVEGEEGVYVLDVRVAVEYGVNCVALAETIRARIAEKIARMTGRTARAINVHVTGIRDKGHREEPHEEGVPLGEEHGIDF